MITDADQSMHDSWTSALHELAHFEQFGPPDVPRTLRDQIGVTEVLALEWIRDEHRVPLVIRRLMFTHCGVQSIAYQMWVAAGLGYTRDATRAERFMFHMMGKSALLRDIIDRAAGRERSTEEIHKSAKLMQVGLVLTYLQYEKNASTQHAHDLLTRILPGADITEETLGELFADQGRFVSEFFAFSPLDSVDRKPIVKSRRSAAADRHQHRGEQITFVSLDDPKRDLVEQIGDLSTADDQRLADLLHAITPILKSEAENRAILALTSSVKDTDALPASGLKPNELKALLERVWRNLPREIDHR